MNLHIEFLVEELSMKEALQNILSNILTEPITYDIHPFKGKKDLLSKLPQRLKGYKAQSQYNYRIVVLIDQDQEDCKVLKQKMEETAINVGFSTKTCVGINQSFQVLNRVVIEELESWFFGDIQALTTAYPKLSSDIANQAKYRDPDNIAGGTWEALEKLLQRAGYHKGGLEKIKAAREISLHMNPSKNRSKSFQVFYDGLLKLIQ